MGKFVGFGEIMVGLNPVGYRRFIQADTMEVNYTGAEANVCTSLAILGMDTSFVTRLPDNDIARSAISTLRKFGVGTGDILFGGDRMGVLYTEKGAAQRPSKVVYDRKYSAVSMAKPGMFNWQEIFRDAEWFHFTGITPALSDDTAAVCLEACEAARSMGVKISCDLNYRKNLWSQEKARATMERLVPYCDLVIGNEEDAEKVLGISAEDTDITAGKLNRDGYKNVARRIQERYGVAKVAITLRESISASDNHWSGMYYDNGEACFSKKYLIHIVNRVGGGDSFAAGLIYSILHNYDAQKAIEFAVAASCLKHSIELDFNLSTLEEIERLAGGDGSGRVQR